jgi:hypothetical protein
MQCVGVHALPPYQIPQLSSNGSLVTAINPKAMEVRKAAIARSMYSFVLTLLQDHAG